jgi:transcriptional regulator with XRE-family HTH domain
MAVSNKSTREQVVAYLNALHIWFKDNKLLLAKDLDIRLEKLDYTSRFFTKLLEFKDLSPQVARTLSNLFKGRGAQTTYTQTLLQQLAEALNIDPKEYAGRFEFNQYSEIKNIGLKLNIEYQSRKPRPGSADDSKLKIEFLKEDNEIYGRVEELIIEQCEDSIQGLMNGGLSGKAPKGWFEKILNFIESRHTSPNPVTFELVIVCKETDIKNPNNFVSLKKRLTRFKDRGLDRRFIIYLCIQNHIWLSPDFLLIDRKHLIFNWPRTLDKIKGVDRTQKGFLISNSFEAIQYFKDFYEKIILSKNKCILLQDYFEGIE